MKKIFLAAGFILAATTASTAQGFGARQDYSYGAGLYDYAPAYGAGGWYDSDRVDGPGRGNSAESQR